MDLVEAAVASGVDCVQIRDKDLPGVALYQLAREIRTVTARAGIPLIVNDRLDVALAVKAHGVHLGARSLPIAAARRLLDPGSLIGYSAHSLEEAEGAALAGADYIFFAPIFTPISKVPGAVTAGSPTGSPGAETPAPGTQGVERLWKVAASCPIPVYALGGITADRIEDVLRPAPSVSANRRPPAGVAVVSALMAASDVAAEARRLRAALG